MSHRGFTLIEVLVAMIIAALAVSIAARIFGTSSDAVTRLAGQSESWTREQNARRWLDQLLSGMQIQNTPQGRFEGTQNGMRFWSHYPVSAGWSEEGRLAVDFEAGRLVAHLPDGTELVVADSLREAWFDYLLGFGANSPWQAAWESGATLPLGIRLRLHGSSGSADTLVFFIGQRT